MIDKRLHPHRVARAEYLIRLLIVQGKCEIASQLIDTLRIPLAVCGDDEFPVAQIRCLRLRKSQSTHQVLTIVQAYIGSDPVAREPVIADAFEPGLRGGKEHLHAQSGIPARADLMGVRPPVPDGAEHGLQERRLGRSASPLKIASYAAHRTVASK